MCWDALFRRTSAFAHAAQRPPTHNEAAFTEGGKAMVRHATRGSRWRLIAWFAAILLLASPFIVMALCSSQDGLDSGWPNHDWQSSGPELASRKQTAGRPARRDGIESGATGCRSQGHYRGASRHWTAFAASAP